MDVKYIFPIENQIFLSEMKEKDINQTQNNIYSAEGLSKDDIKRKLRISVTDGCNFNCFFCHNEGQGPVSHNTGNLSPKEIKNIVRAAVRAGIESVKLTGGEPLIYRYENNNIISLVREINELRIAENLNFSLSMITNGYLLEKYSKDLKLFGLDRITVSLSTLNNSLFQDHIKRSSGNVDTIIRGIKFAINENLRPIKINVVLFQSKSKQIGNIEEIPEIINVARELGVDELRLYTLLWHENFSNFDDYYIYWNDLIANKVVSCISNSSIRNNVSNAIKEFGKDFSSIMYPKPRMVINCDGLPVAIETMKSGRYQGLVPCIDCPHPNLCQEGPYAIRVSANAEIRGCLLSKNTISVKNLLSDEKQEILKEEFEKSFSLLP